MSVSINMNLYDFHPVFKIILVGDAGVGKSSLIRKYTDNKFDEGYAYTIGVDFKIKEMIIPENKKKVKLQIWDTAGQECFRCITTSYYKRADGIILLYDVTNNETFKHIEDWLKEIQYNSKANIPLTIVGNKMDILNQNKRNEEMLLLKKFVKEKNNDKINFILTSVKINSNVQEIFHVLVQQIYKYQNDTKKDNCETSFVSLNMMEKENMKKFCCA